MEKKTSVKRRDDMANPFIDSQFKLIFDEENTRLFLNSILKLKSPIVELHIENSESNDFRVDGKRIYFDVLCRDESGREFIVEMQNLWQPYLTRRIIYYICRTVDKMGRKHISDSGKGKGDRKERPWLYDIKPVYAVCLLNSEDRSLDEQYLRQDAVLYDVENERVFSDALRVIVINLPMLNPGKLGISDEYYKNLLLLMHQISTNMSTVDELLAEIESTTFPEEMKTIFRRVVTVSDISTMTEKQLMQYEEDFKIYNDSMASLYCEREEGRAEGREEGKKEATLDNARKMKAAGISESVISEITELPMETVSRL